MNNCLFCNQPTSNPKFCNNSCAARYNNSGQVRKTPKTKNVPCSSCGEEISVNIRASAKQVKCDNCRKQPKIYTRNMNSVKRKKRPFKLIIDKNYFVRKKYKTLIHLSHIILNLPTYHLITWHHIDLLKCKITEHLYNDNMSPKDINEYYGLNYSDFGMTIKTSLNIKLKHLSEALDSYNRRMGRNRTPAKDMYRQECNFNFNPFSYPYIPGYNKLLQNKYYHSVTNPEGMTRDHMVSVDYGYKNSIDPKTISHPANCEFLSVYENARKGRKCSITIEQLYERIANW